MACMTFVGMTSTGSDSESFRSLLKDASALACMSSDCMTKEWDGVHVRAGWCLTPTTLLTSRHSHLVAMHA